MIIPKQSSANDSGGDECCSAVQNLLDVHKEQNNTSTDPQHEPADNKGSTLQPGPHAGNGVPARGPQRDFQPGERDKINDQGQQSGCHTCVQKTLEPKAVISFPTISRQML
jgi:hypothetical protein